MKKETLQERRDRENLEVYAAVYKIICVGETDTDVEGLSKWQALEHRQTRVDAGEALRRVFCALNTAYSHGVSNNDMEHDAKEAGA